MHERLYNQDSLRQTIAMAAGAMLLKLAATLAILILAASTFV